MSSRYCAHDVSVDYSMWCAACEFATPVPGSPDLEVTLCVASRDGKWVLMHRDEDEELRLPSVRTSHSAQSPSSAARMLCISAGLDLSSQEPTPVAATTTAGTLDEVVYGLRVRPRKPAASWQWVPTRMLASAWESRRVRTWVPLLG